MREHYTIHCTHCPVSELSQAPWALHSGCVLTSHLSSSQTISTTSDLDISTESTLRHCRITEVSKSSKRGPTTCLHACVFYCILNLFEKMYDEHLAVFLHVCSNGFYTIKGLYCQSWKLLFLPAQHSFLPYPGNYTSVFF